MCVPECASTRSEADVVAHTRAVVGREDWVHVDCACEGFCRLLGSSVGLVGGANELHFGMVGSIVVWNDICCV